MIDSRKISIAIPTFERPELTIDGFIDVYNDERISEIVIVDDCSAMYYYEKLKELCDKLDKVKLYRNASNQNCYANKMVAVSYCANEFCILLDSDNKIDHTYIDRIFKFEWDERKSYMPCFAKPTFNYTDYAGLTIGRENVSEYMGKPMFDTMLNCMNFFINKNQYLDTWDGSVDPHTADSIYFNYCWFKRGNKMHVVSGLEYFHLIHNGSHYITNNHKTGDFYEKIKQNLCIIR